MIIIKLRKQPIHKYWFDLETNVYYFDSLWKARLAARKLSNIPINEKYYGIHLCDNEISYFYYQLGMEFIDVQMINIMEYTPKREPMFTSETISGFYETKAD
jgi:hypothetical protein